MNGKPEKKKPTRATGFMIREIEGIDAVCLALDGRGYRGRPFVNFIACRKATAANWITFLESLTFKISFLMGEKTPSLASPQFRKWCMEFGVKACFMDPVDKNGTVIINPPQVKSDDR